MDHFKGYECLLPAMLLSSEDPVIERTGKRLLLQLYSEKIQEIGAYKTVDRVIDILIEEHTSWEARRKRLRTYQLGGKTEASNKIR